PRPAEREGQRRAADRRGRDRHLSRGCGHGHLDRHRGHEAPGGDRGLQRHDRQTDRRHPADLRHVSRPLRGLRALGLVAALLLLSGCAGLRTNTATRYLGILLNARNLGAAEFDRLAADDPAIRDCLARSGPPDFLLELTVTDVEFVYYTPSRL